MRGIAACAFRGAGILLVFSAALTRLGHCSIHGLSPRGLAVGAALSLLSSIALQGPCCGAGLCKKEEPHSV
jgi:hypothetical protein